MAFSTGLLLKVLAGLGATAGAVTGGVFLFKKGKKDPAPTPKPPTFEERLKAQIPELVTGENQLCSKTEGTKYTCNANDTLKNALKFTSNGNDEWNLDDSINGQKIEIRENPDTQNFPFGIMLIFENMNSEIKIKKKDDTNTTKTFKQKTFPEFKLENGKFKYAWTIKTLGEKVGLDCKEENGQKTCTLKSGAKINVKDDNTSDKKVEDVTFTGTLNWQEDQGCYNQGFKLTPTSDITLSKEGETSLAIEKLVGGDTSYDIKFVDIDGTNKWYLRKYNASNQ